MAICREIHDRESVATLAGNLGVITNTLGDNRTALEYHQQSLLLNRETGKTGGEEGASCLALSRLRDLDRTTVPWRRGGG